MKGINFWEKGKRLPNGFFLSQALPSSISSVVEKSIFILVYLQINKIIGFGEIQNHF